MTISQVGSATRSTTDQTAITPTGATSGDVLIVQIAGYNFDASATYGPSGWTRIQAVNHISGGDDNIAAATWYYICGGSIPGTHVWTYPFGQGTIICTAWRGVDNTTPIDTFSVNDGFTAAPTGASITTASDNMILWLWMGDCNHLTAGPSGYTIDVDGTTESSTSTTPSCGNYGAYHKVSSGGTTGSIGSTSTGSDDWVVQVLSLLVASGGGISGASAGVYFSYTTA